MVLFAPKNFILPSLFNSREEVQWAEEDQKCFGPKDENDGLLERGGQIVLASFLPH
jgi:hypothetical protein